jgi:ribosomal protein S18 acetylase RimI-like enzyme
MQAVTGKIGLTPEDMASGHQSIVAFYTCFGEHAPGAWVVEHVATRPEYRRRGVINALLDAILDRGREQGFKLAQVSVYIGNTAAERAYMKAGFEYVDEKRHPDFEALIGCPGVARYLRDI